MNVNQITIVGRLGSDPELSKTKNDKDKAGFSVAVNNPRKLADGSWEEDTEWFTVECYGYAAAKAGDRLRKGSLVYVSGRFASWDYEDKRYYKIVALNVQPLEKSDGGGTQSSPLKDAPPANFADDDIPF